MFKQFLDTDYDIKEQGECFSHKTNKLLKPSEANYPTYCLTYPDGTKKKTFIHRMVALTFLPNPENKEMVNHIDGNTNQIHRLVFEAFKDSKIDSNKVINHIDGNKLNNNLENLEEISRTENNLHAFYVIKTNKTTRQIAQYDKNDNFIQKFESLAEAKRKTGVNNISRAANQGTTAGGYYWKYI